MHRIEIVVDKIKKKKLRHKGPIYFFVFFFFLFLFLGSSHFALFCTCNGWNNPVSVAKNWQQRVNEFREASTASEIGLIGRQFLRRSPPRPEIPVTCDVTRAARDFPRSIFADGAGRQASSSRPISDFPDNRNRNSVGRTRFWPAAPSDEIRTLPSYRSSYRDVRKQIHSWRRVSNQTQVIERRSKTPEPSRWAKRCSVCLSHTGQGEINHRSLIVAFEHEKLRNS